MNAKRPPRRRREDPSRADSEISLEWPAFLASFGRTASRERVKKLMDRGFYRPGDVEKGWDIIPTALCTD